jgi:hypothetical protein
MSATNAASLQPSPAKRRPQVFEAEKMTKSVGYGRPPVGSRFKPGRSGNPAGRPKGVPSFRSDLAAELQRPHEISENGTPISKQRAVIKSLTGKAMDDIRAATVLFAIIKHYRVGTDEPAPEVDVEDLDQLESYLANERKRLTQLDPSAELDAAVLGRSKLPNAPISTTSKITSVNGNVARQNNPTPNDEDETS